jgi:hypothetical protein
LGSRKAQRTDHRRIKHRKAIIDNAHREEEIQECSKDDPPPVEDAHRDFVRVQNLPCLPAHGYTAESGTSKIQERIGRNFQVGTTLRP